MFLSPPRPKKLQNKNKILVYNQNFRRVIWKRANIFLQTEQMRLQLWVSKQKIILVPTKSRFPNFSTLKLPNLDQGLIFYLLGHRVMFPTEVDKQFCKNLLARYY